jgi:hypothetical protein
MKIVIHNMVTGEYLGEGDQWVEKLADARDFQQASRALDYISNQNWANIEMSYVFPDKIYNFNVTLGRQGPMQNQT